MHIFSLLWKVRGSITVIWESIVVRGSVAAVRGGSVAVIMGGGEAVVFCSEIIDMMFKKVVMFHVFCADFCAILWDSTLLMKHIRFK